MPRSQRRWTDNEVAILQQLATYYPVELIAKQLNRSLASVRGKARLLGIFSLTTEDNYLSPQQIADLLNCDRREIQKWCNKGLLRYQWSAQTSEKGQRRIRRLHLKRFYRRHPFLPLWRNVPKENLRWLLE